MVILFNWKLFPPFIFIYSDYVYYLKDIVRYLNLIQKTHWKFNIINFQVITARHCDIKVFGLSLITNECITNYDQDAEANHEEVLDVGRMRQEMLRKYVSCLVKKFSQADPDAPWNDVQYVYNV